ncbi:MAG: DUF1643 domain-containing protein [Tissierellaceae bacterium]|nr:DUF1643 domain-containing protein [Tissierellaceae bacterium]
MVITQKSTMKTEVIFSEDKEHRYLLRKEWDKKKKKAMIIMKNPSDGEELIQDIASLLVVNNLVRLDFGSVDILNLYSKVNTRRFSDMERDKEDIKINNSYIEKSAVGADIIILAWGSGCSTNKKAAERQQAVLELLVEHKGKLVVIEDKKGRTGFHPLSPQVRQGWKLKKLYEENK